MLENSLHHAASVGVGSQREDLIVERIHDEAQTLGWHTFDALLHHMIAILVFDALQQVLLELGNKLIL